MTAIRRRLGYVLVAAAGFVAGLVFLIGSGGAQATAARTHQHALQSAPATAVSLFGVFARAASPEDALPSQSAYAGGISRRIGPATDPISAWAVSTGDQMCVTLNASAGVGEGGPAACDTLSNLAAPNQLLVLGASSKAATSSPSTAPQVLVGLVPNGASTVAITFTDGSSLMAPVTDNGFLIHTAGRTPAAFQWSIGGTSYTEKG